jgi:uncharacterized protein YndB with AHSA1/START domain
MATTTKNKTIVISSEINAPVQKVWEYWTDPKHIIHWNNASDDWQTSIAENDLRVGGKFMSRMEAKDGSFGFDFTGEYNKIYQYKEIEYTIEDGRVVNVSFASEGDKTLVTETFEAEQMNSLEAQQQGWQSILDNFKKYVENSVDRETLHFEISIDAPVEDVYRMMLDEKFYTAWTSVFNPYSHYRGSWKRGPAYCSWEIMKKEVLEEWLAGLKKTFQTNMLASNTLAFIKTVMKLQKVKKLKFGPVHWKITLLPQKKIRPCLQLILM